MAFAVRGSDDHRMISGIPLASCATDYSYCAFCYSIIGDIFIGCLKKPVSFLKLRPAVSSPGSDPVTVPVITRAEFALTPLSEEYEQRDAAIRNWERLFKSVTEFLELRHCHSQNIAMPAVSDAHCSY